MSHTRGGSAGALLAPALGIQVEFGGAAGAACHSNADGDNNKRLKSQAVVID